MGKKEKKTLEEIVCRATGRHFKYEIQINPWLLDYPLIVLGDRTKGEFAIPPQTFGTYANEVISFEKLCNEWRTMARHPLYKSSTVHELNLKNYMNQLKNFQYDVIFFVHVFFVHVNKRNTGFPSKKTKQLLSFLEAENVHLYEENIDNFITDYPIGSIVL